MSSVDSFFTARSSDDVPPIVGGAMMHVPSGLVHPARAEAIGAVIGITAEEVLAVARYEATLVDGRVERPAVVPVEDEALFDLVAHEHAGVPALRRHLSARAREDLLIDAIPVIPIELRPMAESADPAVRVNRTHPVTAAYDVLARNVERLERLSELSAPEILVAAQNRAVQAAFDQLLSRVCNDAIAATHAPKPPLQLAPPPTKWRSDGAYGLLFLDEKRLLVQTPKLTKIIRLRGGAVLREISIALPARYYANERVVFADAVAYVFVKGGLQGVALFDVAKGTFDATLTEKHPVRVLTDGVMDDGAAVVWDPHEQTGTGVDVATFGPIVASYTPDGALGWVLGSAYDGAIVELATADLFARSEDFPFQQQALNVLDLKGNLARGAPFAIDEEFRVTAIALTTERRYRLLGPNGVIVEDDHPLFALAFRPEAAAWSPDARRLAVLTRGTMVVIEVGEEPKITARYKL